MQVWLSGIPYRREILAEFIYERQRGHGFAIYVFHIHTYQMNPKNLAYNLPASLMATGEIPPLNLRHPMDIEVAHRSYGPIALTPVLGSPG